MQIHHWQAELAESQKEDHKEVMAYLIDIANNQTIMLDAQNENKVTVTKIMGMMQQARLFLLLRIPARNEPSLRSHTISQLMGEFGINDRRRDGLQSNLLTIQQKSGQLLPDYELQRGEVRKTGGHPVGGTPGFDIWEGEYLGREKVAIKVMRGIEVTPRTREVCSSIRPSRFSFVSC